MERMEADVCVVGAGFAGLVAAQRLSQEGLSVVVLEARDRVGGRAHTETLPGGATIDHGGAWLGPGQDAAYGLAAEVGVETYPTFTAGESAPLTGRIRFDPPLPVDRAHLTHRMPIGAVTTIGVIYDDAWWRADGLNATSLDPDSPASLTLDGCARSTPPGIVSVIVAGPASRAFNRLDPVARRRLVVDALATRFGPKAKAVADYREHDWGAEEYSRGGYMAHTPPGALTGFGRALREPFGPIHWAGTETSTVSHGSFDGAIRSGVRAADEILAVDRAPAAPREAPAGAVTPG